MPRGAMASRHGDVFLLDSGDITLLDSEFWCLNYIAFDFANCFAVYAMEHGQADPPDLRIAERAFGAPDLRRRIGIYLDNVESDTIAAREAALDRLTEETTRFLMLSDFMYALVALPLSLEPIQKIRFSPYAYQRFHKFLAAWSEELHGC